MSDEKKFVPVMITPFNLKAKVDLDVVSTLIDFYLAAGVKGFLKKDIHPNELKYAIHSVMENGYYYSHNATGKLLNLFRNNSESHSKLNKTMLTETDIRFLQLSCSEMTYKEIAQEMKLNPRGVDNLRDNLFTKLDVKSRVGLAMYAIRHGLVTI